MPMEQNLNDLVIVQAARWHARLGAPNCTDAERDACIAWRARARENDIAFLATAAIAQRVSQSPEIDRRFRAMAAAARTDSMRPVSKRTVASLTRWRAAAAVVLCATLSLVAAAQAKKHRDAVGVVSAHENKTRQQQRIELSDGTVVFLDVGAQFEAHMSKASRRIELIAGRAYFDVTHDATRPFIVNAGGIRTVDLGTRFEVAMTGRSISVTLAEGSVEIAGADQNDWNMTLVPGEQFRFTTETGTREKRVVDALAITSWSQGRLVFNGTPLAEALDEVNRYADTKLRLGDQALAAIPIGGSFIAGGDSEQVVEALAAVLPLRVVRVGANEIVLFQRYETETS